MKIVLISDTHSFHDQVQVPSGDILIHAGDFSRMGRMPEVTDFLDWFSALPHQHKIFISGNHDFMAESDPGLFRSLIPEGLYYLENESLHLEGIHFWGSPITPTFMDWAFNRNRGSEIQRYWERIPEDVDILITHGPPFGVGDEVMPRGEQVGCESLRAIVDQIKPKYHLFGHVHEGYGQYEENGIHFFNGSNLNEYYEVVNAPIVFEWK